MALPTGNKTNIFPDDIDQLAFDIGTQLHEADIESLVEKVQWILVGRNNNPRVTAPAPDPKPAKGKGGKPDLSQTRDPGATDDDGF